MKDCRIKLLQDLELLLLNNYETDKQLLSAKIVKILANYEIIERCTEIVPVDGLNEKLIKRYVACLLLDGKSKGTAYQYKRTCEKLSESLIKPFTEMGVYDIRFFLATEKERGVSNVTLENTRANLSAFFQWLLNDEVIAKNPMASLKPIKCKQEVKLPFSDVEIDTLRSACTSKKERALIEILLASGIRVSELSSMEVKDINFQNLTIHVVHGKGDKERLTYITPVAAVHVMAYLKSRIENGTHLFYNKNHEPLDSGGIRFILNSIAKRVNVENVHPHRFRRTFATGLANRGMDIQEIQQLLGHSSIDTTMTYVCVDKTTVQTSYRKFMN